MQIKLLRCILQLLLALTRVAIEHDRGFMSRKTWDQLQDAVTHAEDTLAEEG